MVVMNEVLNEVTENPETAEPPAVLNGLPVSQIRSELERILRSRVFVHSHRIRRFLQFVVEECLAGQQHRLKEYLIGLEVFNRLETFDPRVDSIVRVEARRLRTKLDEYYQTEGQENEIRIELRKGSYVPIFEHRRAGAYGGQSAAFRRHSLAIGQLTGLDGDSATVAEDLRRKLSHALVKEGHFQVLAGADRAGYAAPDGAEADAALPGSVTVNTPKADFVLEGQIEHNGNDTQLLLQLLNVADNAYVWSDSGERSDLDSLARSLNRAVITYGRPENGRTKLRSAKHQSFDLYLQGRYLWKNGTPDNIRNSIPYFTKAVELDGSYAAAWAAAVEAMIVASLFGYSDPRESCAKMREAALKATSLGDTLPEAHVALAAVASAADWDWETGEREFQRAIQLDGRNPKVHLAYAIQLACRGLSSAAMLETERALELDPASLMIHFILGWLHGTAKRYDEAIAQHSMVSRLAPDFPLSYLGLGWAHLGKGQFSDALGQFTNASNLMRARSLLGGCLGHCYAKLNQRDEAFRQLSQLTNASTQYSSPVSVAAIYAGLGQNDRALSALDQAAEMHDCSLPIRILNPEFDALRGESRFGALIERMRLSKARFRSAAG